ncbi:MAG: AAA family ATPase [Acidimicrobiales bacterium]
MSSPPDPSTPAPAPPELAPVVTISATYGAGGSAIAPRLAERLGLPFIDRVFSAQAAAAAASSPARGLGEASHRCGPSKESLTEEEEASTPSNRFFASLARAAGVGGMLTPDVVVDEDEDIRRQAEADLVALAQGQPGVVLGRAGAIVLCRRPRAFHVRLDGPEKRRIERAAEMEHIDKKTASERQVETDRARVLYVKRLYRADPTEDRWYHLLVDTTVISLERCVDVLHTAATAYFESN